MKALLLLLIFNLSAYASVSSNSNNAPYSGKVFELHSKKQKLLYDWERNEKAEGDKIFISSSYLNVADKKEVVREDVVIENNKLKQYTVTQNQSKELATLEVGDKEITFKKKSLNDPNAKEKISKEKTPEILVIGPTIVATIRDHWDEIISGKSIKIRFAAVFRSETVGFTLSKESFENLFDGTARLTVKMKASSFVISALIDPVFLTLEKKPEEKLARLTELSGRTLLKDVSGSRIKDLDANIEYYYR